MEFIQKNILPVIIVLIIFGVLAGAALLFSNTNNAKMQEKTDESWSQITLPTKPTEPSKPQD